MLANPAKKPQFKTSSKQRAYYKAWYDRQPTQYHTERKKAYRAKKRLQKLLSTDSENINDA